MTTSSRREELEQLAQNLADLCDVWTRLTGRNMGAIEMMDYLCIDREAFARDLGLASAVDYVESLRGLEIEIPPTFEESAHAGALFDAIQKLEEAHRGSS